MEQLQTVVEGLQKERQTRVEQLRKIDTAIESLQAVDGSNHNPTKRHMSLAARARIASAQRARWAKWKSSKKRS